MAAIEKLDSPPISLRAHADATLPHHTHSPVAETTRRTIVGLLQARLVDGIDLGMQIKQAHWTVKGKDFIQLHEFFEKLHDHASAHNDDIAERLAALGGVPDGTLPTVAAGSALKPYRKENVSSVEHLTALTGAMALYTAGISAAIAQASDASDPATTDLMTEIGRTCEKDLWLIEAHLQDKA